MTWLGQLSPLPTTPIPVSTSFGGIQILVALLTGLLMAFAFQLLLTNLGVAFGISILNFKPSDRTLQKANKKEAVSSPIGIRVISFATGFSILATVNTVLFAACFLAVKLSLATDIVLGAITGIVIWSAYFLIMMWLGSTAVSSIVGSVLSSMASGFQVILSTASLAFKRKQPNEPTFNEQDAIRSIRQEINAALNAVDINNTIATQVEDYFKTIEPPKLDLERVQRDLETLVNRPEVRSLATTSMPQAVDRQTFASLLKNRTDLSKRDIEQVIEQLETIWNQTFDRSPKQSTTRDLVSLLQSVNSENLKLDRLPVSLQDLLQTNENSSSKPLELLKNIDTQAVLGKILQNIDLSNVDVEKLWSQVQSISQQMKASKSASTASVSTASIEGNDSSQTILNDVEDYLLKSYPWQFDRNTLQQDFHTVLYDSDADPQLVRQQLEAINRDQFVQSLSQRNDLSETRIARIADRLEQVRRSVLETVQTAEVEQRNETIRSQLEQFFQSIASKTDIKPKRFQRFVKELLEDTKVNFDTLIQQIRQFDRAALQNLMAENGITAEIETLLTRLEEGRDRLLEEIHTLQEQAAIEAKELQKKLESYLRHTHIDRLNAENISHKLHKLLENSESGLVALHAHLPELDRDTLRNLLHRRQGLTSDLIDPLVEQIDTTWKSLFHTTQSSLDALSDQARKATKTPRRWAHRSQTIAHDFSAHLADYLQHSDKTELTPDRIQKTVQRLVKDTRQPDLPELEQPFYKLEEAIIVVPLHHREDLTEAEKESIATQINQLRHELLENAKQAQEQARSQIENVFATLRQYFDSLQIPDFNYDAIEQQLHQLLDLPQSGLDAISHSVQSILENTPLDKLNISSLDLLRDSPFTKLRERLGQFNHETIETLIKARGDFSETVSNQLITRIEGMRDRLLTQLEALQQDAQNRLDDLRWQAQTRAEATRKAAAAAAWWLFLTAFTSAATSAIAGIVAIRGLSF